MTDAWPAVYLAGLGAFHGLNPAMGWLFAVALGLNRQSRAIVYASLLPIAAGLVLIGWAVYHWLYGHRHRVRFGMQVGLGGLAAWSFLMATAHGAGLTLWPVLMATCISTTSNGVAFAAPFPTALAGVGLHTLAMLITTAFVAVLSYEWVGLSVLRSAWLNVDRLWVLALLVTGGLLVSGAVA